MHTHQVVSSCTAALLLAALLFTPATYAKTTAKMDVARGVYKLQAGSKLPKKGPILKVYAQGASTQYSHVADPHATRPFLVKYTASCSNKGRLTGGGIVIGNSETSINTGDGFSSRSVWVNVPYSRIAKIKPDKHCNVHAKTLSLEQNKPLDAIVRKGFVMKVPHVLSAKGTAFCTAAGLGKGDVASDTTDNLGVFVHCVANPKARSPKKTTKTKKGGGKDPGPATTIFKTAQLKAISPNYSGTCPAPMKFQGTIKATGKGHIEYQLIGNGNYQSPTKKLTFKKAGKQSFQWTRMVRKPDTSSTLTASGGKTSDAIQGWMQLRVIYKMKNNIASTKRTWLSKRQPFKVNCGSKPARKVR